MSKAINLSHISTLWGKMKEYVTNALSGYAKSTDISDKIEKDYIGVIIPLEDDNSTTAGTWLAKSDLVTELEDGRIYHYKIAVAGATTTYLNINGLGNKVVYRVGTTKLTTNYGVGRWIMLSYNASDDSFYEVNGYDANSYAYVRQYVAPETNDNDLPLLFMYDKSRAAAGSYVSKYTRYIDTIFANPSKGSITAKQFVVTDGASSQFLKADGSLDSNTYLEDAPSDGNQYARKNGAWAKVEAGSEAPSLDGYATEAYVDEKIGNIESVLSSLHTLLASI